MESSDFVLYLLFVIFLITGVRLIVNPDAGRSIQKHGLDPVNYNPPLRVFYAIIGFILLLISAGILFYGILGHEMPNFE